MADSLLAMSGISLAYFAEDSMKFLSSSFVSRLNSQAFFWIFYGFGTHWIFLQLYRPDWSAEIPAMRLLVELANQ